MDELGYLRVRAATVQDLGDGGVLALRLWLGVRVRGRFFSFALCFGLVDEKLVIRLTGRLARAR